MNEATCEMKRKKERHKRKLNEKYHYTQENCRETLSKLWKGQKSRKKDFGIDQKKYSTEFSCQAKQRKQKDRMQSKNENVTLDETAMEMFQTSFLQVSFNMKKILVSFFPLIEVII